MPNAITVAIEDRVATLTIDDGRANAMSFALLNRLDEALREAEVAHVLVIRGREKVLSGGLDLPSLVSLDRPALEEFLALFDRVHERLLTYPRPIVTCAQGSAIAGGAILLCAGDIRLAADAGKVGINESMLGFSFPTSALELVRVALGDQKLAEAAISGRLYEGSERVRLGFVTEVVSASRLNARAHELAKELAEASPDAVAYIRQQIRRPALERVQRHAAEDRARFLDRWMTPETQQRVQALVARLTRREAPSA